MNSVLALLVLAPFAFGESNVEAHLKPKAQHEGLCVRDLKEVPNTSGGPRKVTFEETRQPGYFAKPVLQKIMYLNQDFDKHRDQKMQAALHATVKNTVLSNGNESSIGIERIGAYIPKDIQKNKEKLTKRLKFLSTGNFDTKAGADLKVVAIYLTWTSALEKIAKLATNTSEDQKNVYILLEDDVSFGNPKQGITDWADQVMCHVSKLPPDWDIYKFGAWGESLARRKDETCGTAHAYNEHSCQLKLLQGEDQWQWMGNMGFAIRPRGAARMLQYLRTKQVMDVDGAMLPTSWSNMRMAPNYYHSRTNLVWHKSPINGRSGFLQTENTETTNEKTNFLKEGTPKRLLKGQMEVWYVNLDSSHQRKSCIEGQLKKQFIEPRRFSAIKYPTTCGGANPNKNCMRKEFGDCIKGGINWAAVSSHGTMSKGAGMVQKGVIANWCSHKRMFDTLVNDTKREDKAEKYYVILEDDVILSPKFRLGLENFISSYTGKWKYIQVDPFGAEGKQIAFHNGKVTEPGRKGEKLPGDNYGMHCLVVKQSEVEGLRSFFETHEVIPIDWIADKVPGMITWAGNIAQNPEGHNGFEFQKPSFCTDGIYKSTIAGEIEEKQKKR